MRRYAPDPDWQTGQREVQADVQLVRALVATDPPSELGGQRANQNVVAAGIELLRDERSLERGSILCRVLRLPQAWTNTLLEYFTGASPYDRYRLDLEVTLLNAGDRTLRLSIGANEIPDFNPDDGSERKHSYQVEEVSQELAPGETVDLDARWAIHNLLHLSHQALRPGYQRAPQPEHAFLRRPLREVAFNARWSNPRVGPGEQARGSVDSLVWQEQKGAEAKEAATRMLSGKGADPAQAVAVLEGVRPWWPLPDGFEALLEKAKGRAAA